MRRKGKGERERGKGFRSPSLTFNLSLFTSLAPNLSSALLAWYDTSRRDLPWRDHPDPYAVLVSEIMLQQTTVPAVLPYFEKWMQRYPTVHDLAGAEPEDVMRQWEGLGYYSRARNLHATAKEVVESYGGQIPTDPAELRKLPGIGDYTAAAVASIAFGVRAPALDANNIRVWSRLLASSDKKRLTRAFSRVLPPDRPGDLNQAVMDLGNSVCTPRDPACPACPLNPWCRAHREGTVPEYPVKKPLPVPTHIEAALAIVLDDGHVLVQKRPEEGLLAGMWEFPGGKIGKAKGQGGEGAKGRGGGEAGIGEPGCRGVGRSTVETPEEAVVREVKEETGLKIEVLEKLGVFNHSYTRFRVKLHVFICSPDGGTLRRPDARWVDLPTLESLPMPSANRRIVRALERRLDGN